MQDDIDVFGDRGRDVLEALQSLSEPVGKKIKSAALSFDTFQIGLTQELQHRIGVALAPEETSSGTIEGRLEAINLHDEANIFHIYPAVGPAKVKGRFPTTLREKAIMAVDRNVLVTGIVKYKLKAPYPHEIEVQEFKVLPRDEELPKMADLYGIAPNATNGVPSEMFVKLARNDWR
jgi:hypothetical protein